MFVIAAVVFIWLSMFLQGFSIRQDNIVILKWGWLCLLIGWIFIGISAGPTNNIGELNMEIAAFDLIECIAITLFFGTSLGSGYLCGWLYRRKKKPLK
jgi:hypothetical protein